MLLSYLGKVNERRITEILFAVLFPENPWYGSSLSVSNVQVQVISPLWKPFLSFSPEVLSLSELTLIHSFIHCVFNRHLLSGTCCR